MSSSILTRRGFLALGILAIPVATRARPVSSTHESLFRGATRGPHPTPRPGIDASKVLKAGEIKGSRVAVAAFDEVRQIPQIVDGIRCNCSCADWDGYYSLLTCYEGRDAMAQSCDLCQGHGRYAFRLHKAGKSLDEIRKAIDERYGS